LTLRVVHAFMTSRGATAADLLANTELHESDLADPYNLISEEQARRYYRNVVGLAKEDGIGLEIGWMTALSEMGPQGLGQISARTAGDAVKSSWANRDIYNVLLNWNMENIGDTTVHRISSGETDRDLHIFLIERGLGTLQAHVEELINSEAKPSRVLLDYQPPVNIERYRELFRCPLYFNKDIVEVHYPASYLESTIRTYDPLTHDALQSLSESLGKKLASRSDIVSEVKMALRRKPGEFPSLEQVADKLAMSSRTLRRKLGEQNVRFQDLLDAERQHIAEDYLANSSLSIQQIAEQCGFSDGQNFSQAFKRWLGMSPTEYRNKQNSRQQ
ncbi:MAG: AraC family transcriptional regulator ligand-binding domain-containing protein, partial [Pseudomonadales bacterium]